MSEATAVAAVERLTVRYGTTVAVADVSLAVAAGEVVALLGRNGAGKSSLARCLLGQQRPTAGTARLFGADAWTTRTAAMRRTGVVPETPDLPPAMDAEQLSVFCAALYPRWDAAAVAARLAAFQVPRRQPVGRLSKGQRAQLSLAFALGHSPELLVLDDPTLGLDAVARRAVFSELIADLADRGTTVLVTTHDLAGIEGIADRVGILLGGRLVVDESLEALRTRFRRLRSSDGTAAGEPPFPVLRRGRWAGGPELVTDRFEEVAFATWSAALGGATEAQAMSLEEIFVAVAGDTGGVR